MSNLILKEIDEEICVFNRLVTVYNSVVVYIEVD